MQPPKYPSLYQVNTRVRLTDLAIEFGRKATLDDIPDRELDELALMGFDWIWYLSVWTTGEKGRKVSLENPGFRRDFEATLPDLNDQDIGGSGFAIAAYTVSPDLGGDAALKRLRGRLNTRGMKLMLDFVPNHMGPDHPWVEEHPEYLVIGTAEDLEESPQNYFRIKTSHGNQIFAYGRDPYFAGWPDTVQIDYSNAEAVEAMGNELMRIAGQCDGVRCDMSMLVLPAVFERTWGRKAQPFWPIVTNAVREKFPGFCFMAEVYWEMEWELQQLGFDYTYDKRLYDRLVEGHARAIREHFYAGLDYQDKLARFLENHDEPRAAATFENTTHKAAAILTFLSPGLRFFHQGEFEGKKKRISPHLIRGPKEPVDTDLQTFYNNLRTVIRKPVFRNGEWQLPETISAWDGNGSWDSFIAFAWTGTDGENSLVVVNYAPTASQCYIRLPFLKLTDNIIRFSDLMSSAIYDRDGNELLTKGIYLDMPAWGYHIFELEILDE